MSEPSKGSGARGAGATDPYRIPPETRVGHVRLRVAVLDRAVDFYTGALGFREVGREAATVYLSATGALPWQVALAGRPGAVRRPRGTTGLFHVAILFPDRAGLARAAARLAAGRWSLAGASDHGVSEALYLSDPDGNGIEICADRPRAAWPLRGGSVEMVTEPLDLRDLLAAAGDAGGRERGIPPGTRVGHVHLQVSDLARAEAFYAGLIGLSVTQRSYPGALFLAAGGYHHHLGVNVWAGKGVPPPPENASGLLSFSLALPDAEALGRLAGRLRKAGVPVGAASAAGPDGAVVVRDPDGIAVELVPGLR